MNESGAQLAKRRLEELVSFFGVNAEANVTEGDDTIELEIESDTSGKLIGYHGETMRALQYVLNLMVQESGERRRVYLDVAGYKKARAYNLEKQALESADAVINSGEEVELSPMNAAERRIVHMALRERSDVTTDSRGEDPKRYIVIMPKKLD
jgi:spoIIIJ-associated protein